MCVDAKAPTPAHTHTHTHVTRKTARQLSVAVPVTLVSEVSRERAEVCVCVSFVYMCVDVCRCKGGGRLSIVLQISWQSTSSWPAGDTRGLSGRCELLLPLHVAFVKKKQAELSFQTAAEACGSLLNSHSAPHLNAQWCRFSKRDWLALSSSHEESWERNLGQHRDGC